jgi:FkbM family methyltransferase
MRRFLKWLRVSQPLNLLATSGLRWILATLGVHSEFVVKHIHRAGTTRCRLPNGRTLLLWSRADDWVSNQIYWKGLSGYDPETVPSFLRLAGSARVTLDVGAYVGFYTLLAAHSNPKARVYAFEPHPEAYQRLKHNISLNHLPAVECVHTAVADVDGTAEFFHVPGGLPTSSSLSYEFMKQHGELRRLTVPVISLDRFCREREIPRVDLVKIDTESTEPQVLRGMASTLERDRPTIICEVLAGRGTEKPLQAFLDTLGYRYYLLTPEGPTYRKAIVGDPHWLNYLFTPVEIEKLAALIGSG